MKTHTETMMVDGLVVTVKVAGTKPLAKPERDELRYAIRLCLYSHLAEWN